MAGISTVFLACCSCSLPRGCKMAATALGITSPTMQEERGVTVPTVFVIPSLLFHQESFTDPRSSQKTSALSHWPEVGHIAIPTARETVRGPLSSAVGGSTSEEQGVQKLAADFRYLQCRHLEPHEGRCCSAHSPS